MVIYNPPQHDCSAFLADKLSEFAVRYENIFLIGDFNTDLRFSSNLATRLKFVLQSYCLTSASEEPTFFHNDGCSQLDLLLTNNSDRILRFGQVSFPALSHHDLIFASIDFDISRPSSTYNYRDYTNFDRHALEYAVLSIPWNQFYENDDPNTSLDFFNAHIKAVHDSCIPLRTSRNRRRKNPWFSAALGQLLLERELAYNGLQAPPATKDVKRQQYKVLRNRANAKIAQAKQQYLNRFLDSRTPTNVLWKRVKSLGVGKDKPSTPCDFDPDDVNRSFLANHTEKTHRRVTYPRTAVPSPQCFSFRSVRYWEVVNSIWEVNSNAIGLDELPIKFIKLILPLVVNHLTRLFNLFIEKSTFPDCWKHAKVIPLKKKAQLNDITNLRPISILCSLSKAFEKLLKQQMTGYIEDNRLLSDYQAGFRKGQSIKTAILRVHDDLANTIDKKGAGILLLLDFSKAFDTIPHGKLLDKLQTQFYFTNTATNLLESYLKDRRQTVFCGEHQSSSASVTSGVPQGSVIGPLLFCCHINDLPTVLKFCSIQMYADDVQLYVARRGPCSRELVRMMNADLEYVADWSRRNVLHVNPAKSQAIFIASRRRRTSGFVPPEPGIVMDGQRIGWSDSGRNLGFIFQNDLQWDELIAQQCGKIYASLRTLYCCTSAAPTATKLKLFKSLILPHFLFGDVVHIRPSAASFDRLRIALNCCVRFVYGLNRYDHVSHLQQNLIGCPIHNFYAHRTCLFLRTLLRSRSPEILHRKLIISQGRRLQNLIVPANTTNIYANSLFVRGVVHWNQLPLEIKRLSSETMFKRGCINFYNRDR